MKKAAKIEATADMTAEQYLDVKTHMENLANPVGDATARKEAINEQKIKRRKGEHPKDDVPKIETPEEKVKREAVEAFVKSLQAVKYQKEK